MENSEITDNLSSARETAMENQMEVSQSLGIFGCSSASKQSLEPNLHAPTAVSSALSKSTQSSTGSQLPGLAMQQDATWMSNQQSGRGVQISLQGHHFFQPHLCYGYMPPYHSFMNGACGDYITFGECEVAPFVLF